MPLQAVIFDIDGTLLDSIDIMAKAAKRTAEILKSDVDLEAVKGLIGKPPEEIIKKVFKVYDADQIRKIRDIWAKEAEKLLVKERQGRLFPNAIEVLRWLKENGFKVGLGSSLIRDLIKKIGEAYGFLKYVDAYVGSDEVPHGKPAPDTFLEVARRLRVSPKEAIIVGDTVYDIIAGLRGGFKTILFSTKEITPPNIKPDYIIGDLKEVISIIKKMIKT